MAASQGMVYYRQQAQTALFRVEGRGTMTQALPFRRQAESCIEQGCRNIQILLNDCTHLDSTFLGTILHLKKQFQRLGVLISLINPSDPCLRTLDQMGLADLLPAESGLAIDGIDWTLLGTGNATDPALFKRNVVQAHEELAALPGPAGQQFQQVLRCMNQADPPPSKPE